MRYFCPPSLTVAQGSGRDAPVAVYADREAYYGDLHLHTSYLLDAYLAFGARLEPDDADQFAWGETVKILDQEIKRLTPSLDFLAVTDVRDALGRAGWRCRRRPGMERVGGERKKEANEFPETQDR